jgi:superfamily II DNA or RNA helicase
MDQLLKSLLSIPDWNTFFNYSKNLSKKGKGDLFEKLTHLILKTKPIYKSRFKNVWLLSEGIDLELRKKLNLPKADEGIDLIAENYTGTFCAIQCKFKGANESPTRKDIATFLDLSRNHCKNIAEQILVHTGTNGIKKTELLPDSFTQIGLDFWSQLTEEDWLAIQLFAKDEKVPIIKRTPRMHQEEAISASRQYFLIEKNTRGKLIMPCGTGKSLTAFWITQALASRTTIIAVPSLALLKQSLEDWTKEMLVFNEGALPEWCCICSDESAGKISDDFVTDTYSLGIPTTTNAEEITTFLKRKSPGGKVIFITYQSADKLARVSQSLEFKFDLAILDEAHKTVGAKDKAFSVLLQEDKISIGKRLFMTATERIVKGAESEILSMDDASVYGNVVYKLSFKKAIEEGIITDYKIVTVFVSDSEIQDLIEKNNYITDNNKEVGEAEAQMLTTAIALKKAIKEYNLTHTVSFHKSINASKEFQSLYQKIDTTADSPTIFHISSKLNAGARSELLRDFKNTSKAIITNARCLTEGVDVPAIDCVLFADQKQSIIDIVQASGRALRQYTDKKTGVKKEVGYIIIPVVLKEDESLDDLTNSDRFKTVARIVTSLSTQDETIAEELRMVDSRLQKINSRKIQIIGTINKSINLDLDTFSLRINTKIWERVAKANWMSFEDARLHVKNLNLRSTKFWKKYCNSGLKPLNIPNIPDGVYKDKGWISWGDWLGTNQVSSHLKEFRGFNEARLFAQSLNIQTIEQWRAFCNHPDFPVDIPKAPNHFYKNKGWINYYDWFGTKQYQSFENGKKFAQSLNLKSVKEWGELYKKGGIPADIPQSPNSVYKNRGWKSWGDWLGSNYIANQQREYREYGSAKSFIRKLGLKSITEWKNYCKEGNKPMDIPNNPDQYYKDKGWSGFGDWLGTGTVAPHKRQFKSFKEAREYVHSLGIQSSIEWRDFSNSDKRPSDIPGNPARVYKNEGWKGFGDWLGGNKVANKDKVFLTYSEAKKWAAKLNLKTQKEWNEYFKKNVRPSNIPRNPAGKYKKSGWISWSDWLGTTK